MNGSFSSGLAPQNSEITVMKNHPGFKAVQSQIARRQGISQARAGAILASATRKASDAAKSHNARLKKVKG